MSWVNRRGRRAVHEQRRGSALMLSMMFVLIVAGMGVCMVQLNSSQARRQEQSVDNKRAIYVAEAGLAEGFLAVTLGKTGEIASNEIPAKFGGGWFWVEATDVGDGQVALVSTGLIGKGRFSISAVLQRQMDPLASLGFYSGSDLIIGAGAIVDGFDSTLGTFDSQVDAALAGGTTGTGGRVGAGGDIVLVGSARGETMVYGDASPGLNGVVSLGTNVTVTGSTAPRSSAQALPGIELPAVTSRDDILSSGGRAELTSGKYGVKTVSVAADSALIVRGPAILVIEELVLAEKSYLAVDSSDGPVAIYVTGRIVVPETATILNMEGDPSGLVLMLSATEWSDFDDDGVADDPVDFRSTGDFSGYIYAPDVDLTLHTGMHVMGGLAAKSVTLESRAHLSFDSALVGLDMATSGIPLLVAWRTCDIPDYPITRRSTTPQKYLDDNAVDAVVAQESTKDKYLKIRYFDTSGDPQSYVGLESGFDWSLVNEVAALVWDDDAVVGDEGQIVTRPATLTTKTRLTRETSGKDGM